MLKDLSTKDSPADSFAVYLNLPSGAKPDPGTGQPAQHYVGILDFFNYIGAAAAQAHRASGNAAHYQPLPWERDVTDILNRQGWKGGDIKVTIIPVGGAVNSDAQPTIGSVELQRRKS